MSLAIEGLENRTLLSTITWDSTDYPTGGTWDNTAHWQGGVLPGTSDTAVIDLTSGTVTTGPSDSVLSLTTNASTTVSVANGSLTLGAATSSIGGPITVSSQWHPRAQRYVLDRHRDRDRRRTSHHEQ